MAGDALTPRARPSSGRESVWAAIRALKEFTIQELAKGSGTKGHVAQEYVSALRKAGFVEIKGKTESLSGHPGAFQRTVYRLANDVGVDAPRVNKLGEILPEVGRDRMWRAMRILKEFDVKLLVLTASIPVAPVAEGEAAFYCLCLARAGYLYEIEPHKRYRFLPSTDSGPKAPVIRRVREVVDANTGEVRWSGDAREERP